MSITIQQSTPRDLDFVFSLALHGARRGHFEPRICTERVTFRHYLNSAIHDEVDPQGHPTQVFVLQAGDQRVGASMITRAIGTPDVGVELALIALKPEHRGKGFGTRTLDALLSRYLPRGSVYARCLPPSERLRSMLLKRDFTEVGQSGQSTILRHGAAGEVR